MSDGYRRALHRTVLDHLPDDQRAFVIQQSVQVRQGPGPARADATVLLAALREYAAIQSATRGVGRSQLYADKGYDFDHLRGWLRRRQMPRIARRGIEASARLGLHRRVVEQTLSWLNGCRRLHRRYERKAAHRLAFVGIASTLICRRRLTN